MSVERKNLKNIFSKASRRILAEVPPQTEQRKRQLLIGEKTIGKLLFRNNDAMFSDRKNQSFGVFDGVNVSGAFASKIAENFIQAKLAILPLLTSEEKAKETMKNILVEAHKEIIKKAQLKGLSQVPQTTASVVKILDNGIAVIGNVGDSRVYRLPKGSSTLDMLEHLTLDDGLIREKYGEEEAWNKQRDMAYLNPSKEEKEEELLDNFVERNNITQALGKEENIEPRIYSYQFFPGDRILLLTDGVNDNLNDREITRIVLKDPDNPQKAANQLIGMSTKEANRYNEYKGIYQRAKPDDMTAIVVMIN